MTQAPVPITFRAHACPPAPVAVAALGRNVAVLASRLLQLSDAELQRFSGVVGDGALVMLGPADALPWCDGALYLAAHGPLLWPTWAEPSVHPMLLERALRRAFPKAPACCY